MIKKTILIISIAVIVVLMSLITSLFISFKEPSDLYDCNVDEDCIKVKSGCCGCSSGGGATTINKNYKEWWNEKKQKACKGTFCLTVVSKSPYCLAPQKCIQNKCTLDLEEGKRIKEKQEIKFKEEQEELIEKALNFEINNNEVRIIGAKVPTYTKELFFFMYNIMKQTEVNNPPKINCNFENLTIIHPNETIICFLEKACIPAQGNYLLIKGPPLNRSYYKEC